jgi:membrane-associated phospholipid phosphatase
MPVGMFVVGLADKNKSLQYKAYEMAGGLLITTIMTGALKAISDRPRPYYTYNDIYPDKPEDGSSFPSGHTSVAFSTATTLALECKKWYISVPAFAWAGAVGYSRMYLGQHYPSDIAMGAVVGTGSAFASHWLSKKIFHPTPKKKPLQP